MTNRLSLGALVLGSGILTAYISKQYLDHTCPRIPFDKVSQLSACRQLVDTARANSPGTGVPKPWGADKSGLVPSWSEAQSGDKKTRWISSYTGVQMDVPIALLASYTSEADKGALTTNDEPCTAESLARNVIAAFLDAHSHGLDGWFLDRNLPPRTYVPGNHLFGDSTGASAFMLDTWSSRLKDSIQPSVLPADAPIPKTFFPSNEALLASASQDPSQPETAGTVIYWKAPQYLLKAFNKAASYGLPWRVMDGGWQEFIVEKISEETARVTYITLECYDVHPGGQMTRDFKQMPWFLYEPHVLYAQSLLIRTVRQLKKVNSV
ncbi:uncharacterized protein N7483_000265 [Penicillium malachiteum]|uniref:uncharacterized protein n=1 Tax=Penicillium malachiteum TaxID=1324776 RepID=UPI0025476FE0|nr:uncharacterized protein N7483_000265 [Penicillium malachiteum]KAJ5735140.1 hypothetical protein N7483_000265 [Penicillium malachiteum]